MFWWGIIIGFVVGYGIACLLSTSKISDLESEIMMLRWRRDTNGNRNEKSQ